MSSRLRLVLAAATAALVAFPAPSAALAKEGKRPPRIRKIERSQRELREELAFAAEMARQGLWREAAFRWRRVLAARGDDARLWNNIAVALEATGDIDAARAAYEKALGISREPEIEANFRLFLRAHDRDRSADGLESGGGDGDDR